VPQLQGTGVCLSCRELECATVAGNWSVSQLQGTGVCLSCKELECASVAGNSKMPADGKKPERIQRNFVAL